MKNFKLTLEGDWFNRRDILTVNNTKVRIVSTPKMHLWSRFKKWLGWNYEWYYKVKVI